MKTYFVYVLASATGVLYAGVTDNFDEVYRNINRNRGKDSRSNTI
jgi:predicted GIY-YIG superfamily endonuclease